jgi:hypothetical protein
MYVRNAVVSVVTALSTLNPAINIFMKTLHLTANSAAIHVRKPFPQHAVVCRMLCLRIFQQGLSH